jgi:hypothetical protein
MKLIRKDTAVLVAFFMFVACEAKAQQALLIYGGHNHTVFLGCLNCNKYDANSLSNQYGRFGSKYNSDSIFNKYGQYGSPYAPSSVCAQYATDPPIIVDQQGSSYGLLTINKYAPNAVKNDQIIAWLKGVVCAD